MNIFEAVRFRGEFRDYQQRVLDNADNYIKDGRIHIVAAPGSGKTVLGLELIRRLGENCLVLSPTTAIRGQWGRRFTELFLPEGEDAARYLSYDLHSIRPITSVTYQALYTAVERVSESDAEDVDCSDVDILSLMREREIRTVCLDEAHHLKNEWQKALEKFLAALGGEVRIIALTATPPYDSEGNEWSRYESVCGPIDEEIFVPELVGRNTLCPHQDYVFFNYPTAAETAAFDLHRERVSVALEQIGATELLASVAEKLKGRRDFDAIFPQAKEYVALLVLLRHYGLATDKKLIRELTARRGLPRFSFAYAETALAFLLSSDLITETEKEELTAILKEHSLYEKRKVTLALTEKLRRSLISSVGKLESIRRIARGEVDAMGARLRMLVLTDYIKKEELSRVFTEAEFRSVNTVSIFETLRRELGDGVKLAVLSGSLVILPASVDLSAYPHRSTPIAGGSYQTVEFSGPLHRAVDAVGRLFETGEVQVLIGTKSLLGEGWDSPCINSLILASFVGSFVLSNQMRGRAIRIDKNDPQKTANIWHLVTVEPPHIVREKARERVAEYLNRDETVIESCDFDMLKRRFDAFMGPNYTTGRIEGGIERITAILPPYGKEGIERINRDMLMLSRKRDEVAAKWQGEVADGNFSVTRETEVDREVHIPAFTFYNFAILALLTASDVSVLGGFCRLATSVIEVSESLPVALGLLLIFGVLSIFLARHARKMILHANPAHSVKTLGRAVYEALCECGLIASSAKVNTESDKGMRTVSVYLRNASLHDQNIFNTAMAEMLSPIENPRYILIGRRLFHRYDYSLSFSCPSVLGKKKEYVEILCEKLKGTDENFTAVYTHCEDGRRLVIKCRKKSYITQNHRAAGYRYRVSHWD